MAIEAHEFESGLRVFVDHMPGTHTTAVNVHVAVGSIDETDAEAGLAHIVEHCVFNGNTTFKDTHAIESFAKSNQFSVGAFTSISQTMFPARGPQMRPMLKTYGSMICDSVIETEKTSQELKIVEREAKMSFDNPGFHGLFAQFEAMYGGPYARPVIGFPGAITQFRPENIRAFYASMYHLGKVAIVASGKATFPEVVEVADEYFNSSSLANVRLGTERELPKITPGPTGTFGIVNENSQSNAGVSVNVRSTKELYDVANDTHTGAAYGPAFQLISKHVFEELRIKRQLSYDGGFSRSNLAHNPDTATITGSVTCDPDKVDECIEAIKETVKESTVIKDTQIAEEISLTAGSCLLAVDDPGNRCRMVSSSVEAGDEPESHLEMINRAKALTVEEVRSAVNHVASVFTAGDPYTFITSHPDNLRELEVLESKL